MSIKLEPQDCIDPTCEGEICWDEQRRDYVCMTCDRSTSADEVLTNGDRPGMVPGHYHGG